MGLLQRIKGRLVRVMGRLVRAELDEECCCVADCIPDPDIGKISECDCGPDCDPDALFPEWVTVKFNSFSAPSQPCLAIGDPTVVAPFTNLLVNSFADLMPSTEAGRIIRVCRFAAGNDSLGNPLSFYICSQKLPLGAASGGIEYNADAGFTSGADGCGADHATVLNPQVQLWRHTCVTASSADDVTKGFSVQIFVSPDPTMGIYNVGGTDLFDSRRAVLLWNTGLIGGGSGYVGGDTTSGPWVYRGGPAGDIFFRLDRVTLLSCGKVTTGSCEQCPAGFCLHLTNSPWFCLDNNYGVGAVGATPPLGPPTCEWTKTVGADIQARVFFNGTDWQCDIVDLCGNCGPVGQQISFTAPKTIDGCPPLTCWVFSPEFTTVKMDQGGWTLTPRLAVDTATCTAVACPISCTGCPECIKARLILSGSLGIDGDTETHRSACEWSGTGDGKTVTIECCDGRWRVIVVGGGATLVFERGIDPSMLLGCPTQTEAGTGAILPTSYFFVPGASTLPDGYTGEPKLALVDCADVPTCPTNCDACCQNFVATIAGSTANDGANLIASTGTCHWFGDAIGPGADATLDIQCIDGTWTAVYTRGGNHYAWVRLASATSCPPLTGWFLSENTIDASSPTLTLECACPTDCSTCCATYTFTFLCGGLNTDYIAHEDGTCGYQDLGGGFDLQCYTSDPTYGTGWGLVANLGSAGGSYYWTAPPSNCPPTDPAAWTLHQSGPQPCVDMALTGIVTSDCPMSEAEMAEAFFFGD